MFDMKAYRKDLYDWCKEHGVCARCHRERAATGFTMCPECLERERKRKSKHPPYTAEQRDKRRLRKQDRVKRGECPLCGKPAKVGTLCLECYAKRRNRYQPKYKPDGECLRCHEPALEGKKLCRTCYDKSCKALEIARAARGKNVLWDRMNSTIYAK